MKKSIQLFFAKYGPSRNLKVKAVRLLVHWPGRIYDRENFRNITCCKNLRVRGYPMIFIMLTFIIFILFQKNLLKQFLKTNRIKGYYPHTVNIFHKVLRGIS